MSEDLKDKIAVVTGGTRGIGYSISEALLAEGAKVYICGHDAGFLKTALASLRQKGGDAVDGSLADTRSHAECRQMIQRAVERFGGLDILVNNAGIGIFKPVDQLSPEDWDLTLATNLSGVFYCCREAVPLMRRRGGGYIFNISSLAGVNAFEGGAAYNASKFGLNGFSEALMQDVRHDGIRVSYIMPGSVDTDFGAIPGSKARESWKLTAADIAKAVVDLYKYPSGSLASRIELRPARPPRKR
jgi:3-oxoacyl-[acyl-carrier protein] reductase